MSSVPALGYTHVDNDDPEAASRLIVGTGHSGLTLDGTEFPWTTLGDWTVKFTEDGVATLTLSIVVTLPADPVTTTPGTPT